MSYFHAGYVWSGGKLLRDALIETNGPHLVSVKTGLPVPPGATRLSGLVIPGLVNAHSHAFHRALRGATEQGSDSFWSWRDRMYALADTLESRSYHALATATFAEMALSGITTIGEFHYLHHPRGGGRYADANEMSEAVLAAAERVGLRITLIDTAYLRGGPDQALSGVQLRFGDASTDEWGVRLERLVNQQKNRSFVRLAAGIHSVRALDRPAITSIADFAGSHELPIHVHVSEQRAENVACLKEHGCTPTQLLSDSGALSPRTTLVHATHVNASDIQLIGDSQSTVCMCPTTERELADGIGPASALVKAGARLSVGSDSQTVIDLLEESRAIEFDERLATEKRGHHLAPDLLAAASRGGALSLDWSQAGELSAGMLADFVSIDLDSPRLAGIDEENLISAVVFAATAADVDSVFVGGSQVVSNRQHTSLPPLAQLWRDYYQCLG